MNPSNNPQRASFTHIPNNPEGRGSVSPSNRPVEAPTAEPADGDGFALSGSSPPRSERTSSDSRPPRTTPNKFEPAGSEEKIKISAQDLVRAIQIGPLRHAQKAVMISLCDAWPNPTKGLRRIAREAGITRRWTYEVLGQLREWWDSPSETMIVNERTQFAGGYHAETVQRNPNVKRIILSALESYDGGTESSKDPLPPFVGSKGLIGGDGGIQFPQSSSLLIKAAATPAAVSHSLLPRDDNDLLPRDALYGKLYTIAVRHGWLSEREQRASASERAPRASSACSLRTRKGGTGTGGKTPDIRVEQVCLHYDALEEQRANRENNPPLVADSVARRVLQGLFRRQPNLTADFLNACLDRRYEKPGMVSLAQFLKFDYHKYAPGAEAQSTELSATGKVLLEAAARAWRSNQEAGNVISRVEFKVTDGYNTKWNGMAERVVAALKEFNATQEELADVFEDVVHWWVDKKQDRMPTVKWPASILLNDQDAWLQDLPKALRLNREDAEDRASNPVETREVVPTQQEPTESEVPETLDEVPVIVRKGINRFLELVVNARNVRHRPALVIDDSYRYAWMPTLKRLVERDGVEKFAATWLKIAKEWYDPPVSFADLFDTYVLDSVDRETFDAIRGFAELIDWRPVYYDPDPDRHLSTFFWSPDFTHAAVEFYIEYVAGERPEVWPVDLLGALLNHCDDSGIPIPQGLCGFYEKLKLPLPW